MVLRRDSASVVKYLLSGNSPPKNSSEVFAGVGLKTILIPVLERRDNVHGVAVMTITIDHRVFIHRDLIPAIFGRIGRCCMTQGHLGMLLKAVARFVDRDGRRVRVIIDIARDFRDSEMLVGLGRFQSIWIGPNSRVIDDRGSTVNCVGCIPTRAVGISSPGHRMRLVIGTFGCLIALNFAKEKSPINLILLYSFATFEGMLIAPLLDSYLVNGMGSIVLDAALATAGVTFIAGAYGYTAKRDLSGLGGMLFVGLLGIILASVIGLFLHLTMLYLIISIVAVVVFTGFLVYDFNRLAATRGVTEGMTILFAVSIYLDMLNIFLSLLRILGITSGGGNSRD